VKTTTFRSTFHSDGAVSTGAGLGSPPAFPGMAWVGGSREAVRDAPTSAGVEANRNLWVTREAVDKRREMIEK